MGWHGLQHGLGCRGIAAHKTVISRHSPWVPTPPHGPGGGQRSVGTIQVHISLCETCSPQHVIGTLGKLLPQEDAKSKVWQDLVLYIHHSTVSCALANCNYKRSGRNTIRGLICFVLASRGFSWGWSPRQPILAC